MHTDFFFCFPKRMSPGFLTQCLFRVCDTHRHTHTQISDGWPHIRTTICSKAWMYKEGSYFYLWHWWRLSDSLQSFTVHTAWTTGAYSSIIHSHSALQRDIRDAVYDAQSSSDIAHTSTSTLQHYKALCAFTHVPYSMIVSAEGSDLYLSLCYFRLHRRKLSCSCSLLPAVYLTPDMYH